MALEFPPPLDNIIYCSSSNATHSHLTSTPFLQFSSFSTKHHTLCCCFRWPPHV